MKNIFYSFLIISLIVSCKSSVKRAAKDTTATGKTIDAKQSLIGEFKPFVQGSWVNKDYIKEIAKTRSPYIAREKVGNITTMLIDTKFIEGDSVKIAVGYGNHEGGDFILKFHPGRTAGTIKAYSPGGDVAGNTFELKYSIGKNDTTLILYTFDKKKKPTDTTNYTRVFKDFEGHELGYSTYYLVNKTLISGNYILTDTLNKTSKVNFDSYGKVTGFPGAKTYAIDVDFETPPGNNMDQIDFDQDSKNNKFYAFKFVHDTLNFYQTSYDKDSIDLVLGKRIYKLVKQK